MNTRNLLKLLNVKPEEKKIVFFSFICAFCIGIASTFLYGVPLAMLLARFNSSILAYMYIATGLATFFFGVIFNHYHKRVPLGYLLTIPNALFAASLLVFWGLLFVIKSPWIFIVLFVWCIEVFWIGLINGMVLFNQLFTLQQSKRIFGLLMGGQAAGGVITGLLLGYLMKIIGPNNLILLTSFLMFIIFKIQFSLKKRPGNLFYKVEEAEEKISLKSFKNKYYIIYAFIFAVLFNSTFCVLDLSINTLVQKHFPNEVEMGAFYGVLNAIYSTSILCAGFFLSGWIFSRLGLIVALLVLPMGLAILLSIAFLVNLIPSFGGFLFGAVLISGIFEMMTLNAITNQACLLLFQPLKPVQRAWAQLNIQIIIAPLATAAIGVILLVIVKYFGVKLSLLFLMIIGLSLAAVALIIFAIKDGYLKLLIDSLSKRSITKLQFIKLNKDSLNILKGRLVSHYPEEVVYILQTIEGIDQTEFEKALLETLSNPAEQVRCFSLGKIEQYRIKTAEDKLKQICQTETNPAILGSAILALAAITNQDQFKNYVKDSNTEMASSTLIALIKYGSEAAKKETIELLSERTKSSKEDERLTVAKVLKKIEIPTKSELLLVLLKDSSLNVRVAASEAAAKGIDGRLYPALIENLDIAHVRDSAFKSLLSFGKPLLDYIIKEFDHYSQKMQINLINLLGFIREDNASEFLQKLLPGSNRRSLHALLLALKRHGYKATNDKKYQMTKALLESENKNILYLKEMAGFFNSEKTKLMHVLICRELKLSQECCFLLLTFIYPEISIMEAYQGLSLEDKDEKSNGMELLLQTLNKMDQQLLLEQLIYDFDDEGAKDISGDARTEEFLVKIKDYASNCFIPALSAAVTYTIGAVHLKNLVGFVHKEDSTEDPLMKEMKTWTLKQLELYKF